MMTYTKYKAMFQKIIIQFQKNVAVKIILKKLYVYTT